MMHMRLKALIQKLGISQRQFAQEIHLDPGYLSRILQGKNEPPERILLLIEKTFHVNHDWLMHGQGHMFSSFDVLLKKQRVLELIETLDENQIQAVTAFLEYLMH